MATSFGSVRMGRGSCASTTARPSYGSLYLDENEGRFDITTLNDSVLNVWWYNEVSESRPFYEYFYLKKIKP